MSAQPTLSSPISITGGAWNASTYIHVNTDTTNTYYEYKLSLNASTDYYIAYDWSTGKWFDTYQNNHHNTFGTSSTDLTATSRETSADPATVYVVETATPRLVSSFSNPYYGTFTSGGGTSAEGSSTPSGSSYINSQGQIVFVINSSSPSSDGNVVYKIYRRPVGDELEQAYVVPHTSGTDTEWTIGLNYSLYDRWELRVQSSTALVQSATLAVYTTVKKVFCNFW